MVEKLEHYQEIAERMIQNDKYRDLANEEYDKMDHNDWDAPLELKNLFWFRPSISQDPHDAISAGTRVLSEVNEKVNVQPLAPNQESKKTATEWERSLRWLMHQVNRRRQGTVRRSVVRSALKYDEVCAQIIYLPYQIETKKIFKGDTKREEAALRYGDFMVNVYHPNDVHVEHSNLMPESVLVAQIRKAKEVIKEWGEKASGLKDAADEDKNVEYYDYMDYEVHVIWTEEHGGGGEVIIMKEEHNLPFLPWVSRVGGDTMESDAQHRRRPLLYAIRTSGLWQTQNIVNSLRYSEAIAYAAAPRFMETGISDKDATEIEYGDIGSKINVSGQNILTPLIPPPLDPGLTQIGAEIQGATTKSTVSNILQGGDIPAGTAFATLNLATQTAVGALKPYKELAEYALADIYTMFLLWAAFTQESIEGYGMDKESNLGEQYSIDWREIEPTAIYLDVELTADVPLDRMQRANVAMLLMNAGIYSQERAMEDMGITDPDEVQKQIMFETLRDAQLAQIIQAQQYAQQMEMAMAQQQMGMAAQQNQMAGAPGGPGFNTQRGGTPAQMAAPEATREGVTGQTQGGIETNLPMGGL